MGILKHAVLPVMAIAHLYQAYKIVVDGKEDLPKYYGWPGSDDPMSAREQHLMGIILSISLTLAVNCVAGIFLEGSHYRGMACVLELIFFSSEAFDAHTMGFPVTIKGLLAVNALVGLLIHSMEPGIFTKDKTKSKKK